MATQTEVFDYLRLLYARVGITYCRVCGQQVSKDSPESVAEQILEKLAEGTRFYVLFPAGAGLAETSRSNGETDKARSNGRQKKSKAKPRTVAGPTPRQTIIAHIMSLMQRGFTRLYADGQIIELHSPDDYKLDSFDNVFVMVDRLTASPEIRQRLVDSLEICFQEGHANANIETAGSERLHLKFSDRFECKNDGTVYAQPEPRLFSFNNPYGACPTCQGFGNTIGLDMDLVIPNPGLSLKDGAIEPWTKPQHEWAMDELRQFCKAEKISMTVPFAQLSRAEQRAIIEGKKEWGGVRGFFDWMETKKYKLHVRVFLSKYRGYTLCPDCGGGRLRQEARDVKVGGRTLTEVSALSIKDAAFSSIL